MDNQQYGVPAPQPTLHPAPPNNPKQGKVKILIAAIFIIGLTVGLTSGFFIGSSGKAQLERDVDSLQDKAALYDKYEDIISSHESGESVSEPNITTSNEADDLSGLSQTQMRARDVERKVDLNAISVQLEVFYADNGYYPDIESINTQTLAGLDEEALISPDGNVIKALSEGDPAANSTDYNYYYSGNCSDGECANYTLLVQLEDEDEPHFKESLNGR